MPRNFKLPFPLNVNVPLFTERLEVVAWEPPRLLRLAHGSFVHGIGEWRLAEVARGDERGTRFTWEERLSLGVPVAGPVALAAYRHVGTFKANTTGHDVPNDLFERVDGISLPDGSQR